MVLSVQCVDGDVNQVEDHFTAIHVPVRVLLCKENTISPGCFFLRIKCKQKNTDTDE